MNAISIRQHNVLFFYFRKEKGTSLSNVIKLRDDEPSGYYCLDGIFI